MELDLADLKVTNGVRLFLCGDVMLGRGIDQILPHPGDPALHEEYMHSAADYAVLAERKNGTIQRPANFEYVWGDVLAALQQAKPALRIVNLETSITTSSDFAAKGINYRMNPANVAVLQAAGIDCCVLSNNHVLDFGTNGLDETLRTLESVHIRHAGAGRTAVEASAPAQLPLPGGGRVLVFAFGLQSSGIPPLWAAGQNQPGVNFLSEVSETAIDHIAQYASAIRNEGDLLVASLHWGGNWGYTVLPAQRAFAHDLIDIAGFHLIHGHSSHHPRAIEIYRDRLILYGCGDFITDYEGISGYEEFRPELSVAYLPQVTAQGALTGMTMIPFRMRKFRLNRATAEDARWLQARLERESSGFATHVRLNADGILSTAQLV